jgi:hypothetical protein
MSETYEPVTTPLRREKAMLMTNVWIGGTLTLIPGKLIWKRSGWSWSQGIFADKGPDSLEIDLSTTAFGPGGRRIPWFQLLFTEGPLTTFLGGGLRKTVEAAGYSFSVKNADSWLQDIERAGWAAGDVHADVRGPMNVEEAGKELGPQGR